MPAVSPARKHQSWLSAAWPGWKFSCVCRHISARNSLCTIKWEFLTMGAMLSSFLRDVSMSRPKVRCPSQWNSFATMHVYTWRPPVKGCCCLFTDSLGSVAGVANPQPVTQANCGLDQPSDITGMLQGVFPAVWSQDGHTLASLCMLCSKAVLVMMLGRLNGPEGC